MIHSAFYRDKAEQALRLARNSTDPVLPKWRGNISPEPMHLTAWRLIKRHETGQDSIRAPQYAYSKNLVPFILLGRAFLHGQDPERTIHVLTGSSSGQMIRTIAVEAATSQRLYPARPHQRCPSNGSVEVRPQPQVRDMRLSRCASGYV